MSDTQTMLVALGVFGKGTLMGYRGGDVAEAWVEDYRGVGRCMDLDDMGITPTGLEPGLYVWRGEIVWTQYENGNECYPEITGGTLLPATSEDVANLMGLQDPPPVSDPNEDRDEPGV